MSKLSSLLALVACAAVHAAHAQPLPRYSAERIALPPAYRATAMNAAGEFVGYKLLSTDGRGGAERLAYRQRADDAPRVFRDRPGGDRHGSLLAVNDSGLAVGYGSGRSDADRHYGGVYIDDGFVAGMRASLVTPGDEPRDLSVALPADADSLAQDVNAAGQVAGSIFQWTESLGSFVARPFVWSDRDGAAFPFGTGTENRPIIAARINDAGHVAGSIPDFHGPGGDGFVWDPAGGARLIGANIGRVHGLNNLDQVVGVDAYDKAFVWSASTGKQTLPKLTGRPAEHCAAFDINDAGTVVGVCDHVPTIWMPRAEGYAVADLRTRIDPSPDLPKGGRWSEARRIDRAGRILLRGYVRAWEDGSSPGFSVLLTPRP